MSLKPFEMLVTDRSTTLIVAIFERDNESDILKGVGSIVLDSKDRDLLPYIGRMVDAFNDKYKQPVVQTTTGHASTESKSLSTQSTG